MNCDQFAARMNECLDRRQSLNDDLILQRHARACESCRAEMETWGQIESVIPTADYVHAAGESSYVNADRRKRSIPMLVGSGLAAAIALFVFLAVPTDDADSTRLASNPAPPAIEPTLDENSAELADLAQLSELDPVGWWRNVQVGDWVGQTMPAVKSVQEGVAPIGRSLMRAVTILTIGSDNQTS